ncbi:sensor histidine kinase [Brevundimonas sp.]|uniref:sensor histidine kinase n=1 Tax=Brevundimonas sp. TaxID=1871086 RepID=UPI003D14BA0B
MITRSLRWRLLLGGGIAMLAAVLVAWLFMTVLFQRHLERRLTLELSRDATRLTAGLTQNADASLALDAELTDPRLSIPAGGLYWQASTPATALRSRSLWDQTLPVPASVPADRWVLKQIAGPFDKPIVVLQRSIRLNPNGPPVVVQIAEDADDIASAQSEFGRDLAMFLGGLWLFLAAASVTQVHLGLSPLRRIREDLAALRPSASARLAKPWLEEVQPLAETINALLSASEDELSQARGRAADLAHGLKTPLSALQAQSRRLRETGDSRIADRLDRAIASATATVERELARSRVAAVRRGTSAVREGVEDVLGVIEQTTHGERIAFTNDVPEGFNAPMEQDDLAELLGPLLENAARFARRQVLVRAGRTGSSLWVAIEDDGPGIAAEHEAEAVLRGARLDESGQGHGLGLAIARDLVTASGGTLTLTRSTLGGLRAEVGWTADLVAPAVTDPERPGSQPSLRA